MNVLKLLSVAFTSLFLGTSLASATLSGGAQGDTNQFATNTYVYQQKGSGGKGDIDYTKVLYNSATKDFSINYDLDSKAGIDFMWSVISTGDVKGSKNHAILYTDLKTKTVSAYRYDTELGGNSYKNGDLLATFSNDGKSMITDEYFTINVGDLNNAFGDDWEGVEMGEKGGIWFHTARDSNVKYDSEGNIIDLEFSGKSYVDKGNFNTEQRVSAPLGIVAIAAAFGFMRLRRRKA